jgi:hypothetical protein
MGFIFLFGVAVLCFPISFFDLLFTFRRILLVSFLSRLCGELLSLFLASASHLVADLFFLFFCV